MWSYIEDHKFTVKCNIVVKLSCVFLNLENLISSSLFILPDGLLKVMCNLQLSVKGIYILTCSDKKSHKIAPFTHYFTENEIS